MTKHPTETSISKSKALVRMEYVLLGLCLCVIALRTTFTEGPPMRSTTLAVNLADSLYSLSVSAVLIFSFVLWVIWNICSKRFLYRPAGIEIGLGIFCVATVVAGFAAADKRLAITDIAVFLAPPLMALLLVQILDSQDKVKLVLVVIAALGAVSAYQCAEQFFVSNQAMIEQYEQNPQTMLESLGIEPGTFQQFMFEHRLYSRGVRGFFTTRNSAGSFALMAFFAAIALVVEKFKTRKSGSSGQRYFLACGGIAAIILLSLALTRSKGAIIGFLFSAGVLGVLLRFGDWVKTHRKAILAACLLLCVAGGLLVASYGLKYGRLPGGGSMLVRWQYWHASAKMYADNPLAGVGPGNFGHFYPHYKPAAALESVADPHNFPLSILTQYGPIGLVGFLAMIFVPLWRIISPKPIAGPAKGNQRELTFRTLVTILLIAVSTVLLLLRPVLMGGVPAEAFDVVTYVIVTMYVAPVAVFIISLMLLAGQLHKEPYTKYDIRNTSTAAFLCCAVLAVVLHNLIDFAIFEPGVFTALWALIACLVAIDSHANARVPVVLKPARPTSILIVTATLVAGWAYLSCVLVPVAKSTIRIQQANQAISTEQFEYAHKFLEKAAADDPLSNVALSHNGSFYLHHFRVAQDEDRDLLLRSVECLQAAIKRNDAAYKNFERLMDVYSLLVEVSPHREKAGWLEKAFDAGLLAVERYPGCGRLHFKLAQIADQSDKTDVALDHYKKAKEIEDKYRNQFRQMYPERKEVVSRLGDEKYRNAVQRIKLLNEQPLP